MKIASKGMTWACTLVALLIPATAQQPKKSATAPTPSGSPSRSAPSSQDQGKGKWKLRDVTDDLTNKVVGFDAFMFDDAKSKGRSVGEFQTTPTCDQIGLTFKILYVTDPPGANPGYNMSDGNILLRKPHVVMRLVLDDNEGSAPSITSDHPNEATLFFMRKMTDEEKKDLAAAFFLGGASLTSPGTPLDVYNAKVLRVQLPLADGLLPILDIRPQDSEFQKFATRCGAGLDRGREEKRKAAEAEAKAAEEEKKAAEAQRQLEIAKVNALRSQVASAREKAMSAAAVSIAPNQFESTLQGALNKRATELGIDPSGYAGLIRRLGTVVSQCSSISSAELGATEQYGPNSLGRYRNGLYKDCIPTGPLKAFPDGTSQPGFLISHDLERNWDRQRKKWNGPKFHIDVFLKPPADFKPTPGTDGFAEVETKYVILAADITTPGEVLGVTPTGAIPASNTGAPPFNSDAILTITNGFARPLTRGHYWLTRDDPETALKAGGLTVPARRTPSEFMRSTCQTNQSACEQITAALDAASIAKAYGDTRGDGAFRGVPPGDYYLVISAVYHDILVVRSQKIELKSGANSTIFKP